MVYTQDLILDINSNMAYTVVGAKQGDKNSRIINVHITENGEDYILSEQGVTQAQFRFKKPDGKSIINLATIVDNVIQIQLTAQALAVAGRGYADVVLLSGQSVLSTVSFIINIMSSPSVTEDVISTDEFGYLTSVVADSEQIIYEAQAWAVGSRGEAPVFGEDALSVEESSAVMSSVTIDSATFKQKAGNYYGTTRTFVFAYNSNGNWDLNTTIQNVLVDDPVIVGSLGDYGISYQTNGALPATGDTITAIWSQADYTHNNNAKYYSDLLKYATASATAVDTGIASVVINQVEASGVNSAHFEFDFDLPKGDAGIPATITSAAASATTLNIGQDANVAVTLSSLRENSYGFHFNFGIPRAEGSVNSVDNIGTSDGNIQLYAVTYSALQSNLEPEQQQQARTNIGAIAMADITTGAEVGQFLTKGSNDFYFIKCRN